jgi:multiple sugar transport system ATP-binding protein
MQRVSIGRAIVRSPRAYLMDEPLSNLDAKLRELLRAELKGLQQRLGTTLVFVTHDQVEAMTMGDRIGLVNKGELIQVGTPHEIYNRPANTFVASFVGTPAINLLEVQVDLAQGRAHNGSLSFALEPATRARLAPAVPADGKDCLGIRPEDLLLVPEGGMPGTIYGAENHGSEIIAVIDVGGHRLRATVPAKTPTALNQPVQISFMQDKLHAFDPQSGLNLQPLRVSTPHR